MGVTKTDLYSEKELELAKMAKALSHPARVSILKCLLKANTCINGDLVQEIGLSQATISQHLRELKDAELIQGTIEGVSVSYCINQEKWKEIEDMFNDFFQSKHGRNINDCC